MSRVTVDIKDVKAYDMLPSSMRVNIPYVLANKSSGVKHVAILLGNKSVIFFGDGGWGVSYSSPGQHSLDWVDSNYVVCTGVKATVTLEVE